ncbi:hypothetical protein [Sporosarcina limicola]|uniref:Uncharacterized protein n=1 Tax=Sporosarcina limicola TaxID=34101 RepID=A0A927MGG0_9BACL|nr:hypothetical protein [Sporosarcina limicola]MBE1554168.1 hypothetical protein [Sporosarcina limicola]
MIERLVASMGELVASLREWSLRWANRSLKRKIGRCVVRIVMASTLIL